MDRLICRAIQFRFRDIFGLLEALRQKLAQLPGGALIDLERLNELLVSVNVLYLREFGIKLPERVPLTALKDMLP